MLLSLKIACCILFLLWAYIIWFHIKAINHPKDQLKLLNFKRSERSELRTGDLLLLSGTSRGESYCKVYTNSIISHVIMIVEYNDKLYITEASINQGMIDGVRFCSLTDFIRTWKGERDCVHVKLIGSINTPILKKVINEYVGKTEFDEKMLSYITGGLIKAKNRMFCSEYIAVLYQRAGVLSVSKNSWNYSPGDFMTNVCFNKSYSFEYFLQRI